MTFQNQNMSYEMYINILYKKKNIFLVLFILGFVHEFATLP